MIKKCKNCNKDFEKTIHNKIYCSKECSTFYRNHISRLIDCKCNNCCKDIKKMKYRIKKGNVYCNAKCQMEYEYKNNIRDKFEITKKAHESIRLNGQPKLKGKKSWSSGLTKFDNPSVMKISLSKMGDKNPAYNPDLTDEYRNNLKLYRKSSENNLWKKEVYHKDNYTCQKCKLRKDINGKYKKLNAHHKESYSANPDLGLKRLNGIVFCVDCHKKFHKIFGYKNNTSQEVELFLNNKLVLFDFADNNNQYFFLE